eukprot:7713559-Pyramimonas_sp.AAC.1
MLVLKEHLVAASDTVLSTLLEEDMHHQEQVAILRGHALALRERASAAVEDPALRKAGAGQLLRDIEDNLIEIETAKQATRRKATIVKLRRSLTFDIFDAV